MGAVFVLFDKEVAIEVESCLMQDHGFQWHKPYLRLIEHDKLNMFDDGKGVLLFIHSKGKIMSYLPAGNRANAMTFFAEQYGDDAPLVLAFSKFRDAERSRIDQLLFIFKHEALKHERK